MFISRYGTCFTLILIVVKIIDCLDVQQTFPSTVSTNLDIMKKLSVQLPDDKRNSRVLKLNDFINIERINNTIHRSQENARYLNKFEDIPNARNFNLDLGLVGLKLLQNFGDFDMDTKLDPRKDDDGKKGNMVLPLLFGLKVSALIVGVTSLIGLLILKAFIASKTAIVLAVILALKKLFGGNHKNTYEATYNHYPVVPEHYQYSDHHYGPEIFKGHSEIQDHKLVDFYDLVKDQSEFLHEYKEPPKYEFHEHEASPGLIKGHDFPGVFGGNLQELKHESIQKRRNWKNNGKRKPLSLVIGIPHHEPPIDTYRTVVTGRNL